MGWLILAVAVLAAVCIVLGLGWWLAEDEIGELRDELRFERRRKRRGQDDTVSM